MKVQIKGEPFEYFLGLVLVLYLNSLSFLLAQLCLTVDQASGRDKGLCRISNATGHLVLLWWFFFSFCLWSFHDLSSFLLCPLSLSSASSLLGFFHCSFLLGALCTTPVHYLSFPNIVFGFPNIIRLILTVFVSAFLLVSSRASSKLRGKCEEVWQSREQYPETWSGKWLNSRASH